MKNAGVTKAYRVSRGAAYTSYFDVNSEDEIYDALVQTYKTFYFMDKRSEEPYESLKGEWTLIKTSIEGDEEEYDSSDGMIIVSFDDNSMTMYDVNGDGDKADYYIEYISYYDPEELWYAEVGDFGYYQWVSFRLDDDGYLNLMGAIKYSSVEYASIYWTFKRVE